MAIRSKRIGLRAAAALLIAAPPATSYTEITSLAVSSVQPYGDFAAGKFVRIDAEAAGALSPTEPVPGLDKAARNAAGMVEYRTPATLIVPESPRSWNGTLHARE